MVTRLKEDFTPFFLLHSEWIISIFFLLRIIIRALDQKLPNEVKFQLLTLIHVTFFSVVKVNLLLLFHLLIAVYS